MKRILLLLLLSLSLVGCVGPLGDDPIISEYQRPIEINGAIATMPSENSGPICGTVGVSYCRNVAGLFQIPYETGVASIRWEFDGRPIPEGDDLCSFPYNFGSTGEHHAKVTVVDEFDRTVIYDGPFRVVNPRSDYSNPWYTY